MKNNCPDLELPELAGDGWFVSAENSLTLFSNAFQDAAKNQLLPQSEAGQVFRDAREGGWRFDSIDKGSASRPRLLTCFGGRVNSDLFCRPALKIESLSNSFGGIDTQPR